MLLVTIDTLRGDALGFAGNRSVETPNLDRLAGAGHVFSMPIPRRGHPRLAHQHPDRPLSLPARRARQRRLQAAARGADPRHPAQEEGFATGAFVGAYPLASRFGLSRDFDVYDEVKVDKKVELIGGLPDPRKPFGERPAKEVLARAEAWWRGHAAERRFLWVHLFDPHSPYLPPENLRARFADQPYYGEIAGVGAELRPFLRGFLEGKKKTP